MILGTKPQLRNSKIVDSHSNNIIYCEPGVVLIDSTITFFGSNNIIYLGSGKIQAHLVCTSNSKIYIGPHNYFPTCYNGLPNPFIRAAENTSIFIGSECPISTGVCLESGDGHDTFDLTTGEKLTANKSIFIGDAVWLGRDCHILKGSILNTGSIVGTGAVVTGKHINTGEVWGGVPAKCIRSGIVYGHMNQRFLGDNKKWKHWNSPESFRYNGDEEISIHDLNNMDLEDMKRLKITNGRFIWKK